MGGIKFYQDLSEKMIQLQTKQKDFMMVREIRKNELLQERQLLILQQQRQQHPTNYYQNGQPRPTNTNAQYGQQPPWGSNIAAPAG
jgi:hypothetical protein